MVLISRQWLNIYGVWQDVNVASDEHEEVEWEVQQYYLSNEQANLEEQNRDDELDESQEVEHGQSRHQEDD